MSEPPHDAPAEAPCSVSVTKWPGLIFFGSYEPQEPERMEDIPAPVRERLEAHLRGRLGDSIYEELEFTGGQIIDVEELHRVDPSSLDYQWVVPSYVLHFLLKRPAVCLEAYYAVIWLDKDGGVLEEIDLPDLARRGGALSIVSLELARAAVAQLGHDTDMEADIAYRPDLNTLVWLLTPRDTVQDLGGGERFVEFVVDASTGEILESRERESVY